MKMNCITDAIKLLGLRVGDEFILDGKNFSKYKFEVTENGVREVPNANINIPDVVYHMFIGEFGFTKVPWKPTKYDSYYFSCLDYEDLWGYSTWEDTQVDKDRLKHGIVFKTKEEAIDLAQRMLAAAKEAREDG